MGIIVAGAIFLFVLFNTVPKNSSDIKIADPVSENKSAHAPSTPTPTFALEPKPAEHVVKAGDTLQKIAQKYYGSSSYWTALWNDNSWISDFRVIQPGWELKLRKSEPAEAENLNKELAVRYQELTAPTPSPAPTSEPEIAVRALGSPGSFDEVYRRAGSQFGIPWEILYGLHLIETGLRDGPISSGAGPQGPLQFLPGTWALYGIDGNGDGVADINSAVDAIHGAANYLASHGGVEQGLRSYGNVIDAVYNAARSRGWGD
ncbi:MAG: lytic murein transglycosylase [Candidatus Levybacteria bacterium]|nr:lytic murein transglycosylase [Candidatus Levybacteria bacterium]